MVTIMACLILVCDGQVLNAMAEEATDPEEIVSEDSAVSEENILPGTVREEDEIPEGEELPVEEEEKLGDFIIDGDMGLLFDYSILDDDTARIDNCSYFDSDEGEYLVIPDQLDGKAVSEIGSQAFQTISVNEKRPFVIPDSVTKIGPLAFDRCDAFTGDLIIPDSVTEIGIEAFYHCFDLTGNLTLPKGITVINEYTFSACKFTGNLTIPKGVTSIERGAFERCCFNGYLAIPDSVTEIGNGAFSGASFIKVVNRSNVEYQLSGDGWVDEDTGEEIISIKNGVAVKLPDCFGKKWHWTPGGASYRVEYIPYQDGVAELSSYDGEPAGDLVMPDSFVGFPVTTIAPYAFQDGSGFTGSLIIPDSVTEIGDYAFYNCSGFTGSLTIPDSVETIGEGAFYQCIGLTGALTIPDSVTEIGDQAFSSCNGIKIVSNRSSVPVKLPDTPGHTWIDSVTGKQIQTIAKGTALRDDYLECAPGIAEPYFVFDEVAPQTYTGKAIKPVVNVRYGETALKENVDYTIAYKNNTNAGTASFTITGKGNYAGRQPGTFRISARDLDDADISDLASIVYNGKNYTPIPTITYNKKKLANKKDFKVAYYTNALCKGKSVTPNAVGDYWVKVTGTGNFTGEAKLPFQIGAAEKIPVSKLTIGKIADQQYDGSQKKPSPTVSYGGTELAEEAYELSWGPNTAVGTGKVIITGKDPYIGSRIVTFKITGIPMNKVIVSGLPKSMEYDGTEKEPVLTLTYQSEPVSCAIDTAYEVMTDVEEAGINCIISYKNNRDAGTATVTLTGIHGGSGTVSKTFKITPYDITPAKDEGDYFTIDAGTEPYAFAKGGVKPKPVVKYKDQVLKEGKDYMLSYTNNTALYNGTGTKAPTIKVTGKGNFKGNDASTTFMITAADLTASGVRVIANDVVHKDKAGNWKTKISLAGPDGKALKPGTDYDDKNICFYTKDSEGDHEILPDAKLDARTTVYVDVNAAGASYAGSATGSYRIVAQDISKLTAVIIPQTYTGTAIEPAPGDIIWKSGRTVLDDVTVEIDRYQNNINKGKATVIVKGTGNYGGSKTITFTIGAKGLFWWWNLLF
ncbi:MAG: leucine-rich repeat domain-containing protein [Lachnospiraceae bacterium]|nr:leucine-rich repeat domain-containing protein [Lachnospiraceae bacterium]